MLDDGTREYNIAGAEAFNFNREISSDLNTDIGGLKSMLLARGDHRADYTDIEGDYDSISQSVLMNIEAEFDQLIHNVVTRINDILARRGISRWTTERFSREQIMFSPIPADICAWRMEDRFRCLRR